jgi:hypothetical protein
MGKVTEPRESLKGPLSGVIEGDVDDGRLCSLTVGHRDGEVEQHKPRAAEHDVERATEMTARTVVCEQEEAVALEGGGIRSGADVTAQDQADTDFAKMMAAGSPAEPRIENCNLWRETDDGKQALIVTRRGRDQLRCGCVVCEMSTLTRETIVEPRDVCGLPRSRTRRV